MKQQLDAETRAAMVDYRYTVADISMLLSIGYIMLAIMRLLPFY